MSKDAQQEPFSQKKGAHNSQQLEDYKVSMYDYHEDEIDLHELFGVLWAGKWVVVAITSLFVVLSVVYVLFLPNLYKSTVILAPVESKSGGLGGLAAQYGGLAAMAGINLGSGSGSKVDEALELVTSWPFLESFIKKNNLKPFLLAVDYWDKQENRIVYDREMYNPDTGLWLIDTEEYSSWASYMAFKETLTVSQDKKTNFVSISVEYLSPALAVKWVELLVLELNRYYQVHSIKKAQQNIAFLEDKIEETSVSDMQSVFYSLIEEQTKSLMLASLNSEYLLKTVVSAKQAELKSKPNRTVIVIFSAFIGFVIGAVIILFRYFSVDNKVVK